MDLPSDYSNRWEAYRIARDRADLPPRRGGYSLAFLNQHLYEYKPHTKRFTFGNFYETTNWKGDKENLEFNIHLDVDLNTLTADIDNLQDLLKDLADSIVAEHFGPHPLNFVGVEDNPTDFEPNHAFLDATTGNRDYTVEAMFDNQLDEFESEIE